MSLNIYLTELIKKKMTLILKKDDNDNDQKSKKNDKEFLNQFCVNLNDKASKLKIDPVIGREKKFKEQSTCFREETK